MAQALRDRDRAPVGSEPRAPHLPAARKGLAIFCASAFLATLWPVYSFFGRVHPLVLGMPFSLFYLVTILATVFSVMLGFYLWEDRNDRLD